MRKSNFGVMVVAIVGLASMVGGCASSDALVGSDCNQTGPVSIVAADPMGAAIFGATPRPDNIPNIANVDTNEARPADGQPSADDERVLNKIALREHVRPSRAQAYSP